MQTESMTSNEFIIAVHAGYSFMLLLDVCPIRQPIFFFFFSKDFPPVVGVLDSGDKTKKQNMQALRH